MAASISPPLAKLSNYDLMFQVEVMLQAPVREPITTPFDLHADVVSLCLQLQTLFEKEKNKKSFKTIPGKVGVSFDDKVCVLISRLQQTLAKFCYSQPPQNYLKETGIDKLFPDVYTFIIDGKQKTKQTNEQPTAMEEYLNQFSSLHHILGLCRQLLHDCLTHSHKYLAHQMAVLYHSLTAESLPHGSQLLYRHCNNIKANFPALKQAIADCAAAGGELDADVRGWLVEVVESIVEIVSGLPPAVTAPILPIVPALTMKA